MDNQYAPKNTAPAGFLAGTPVHSLNGLVPIEQIQAGDWLLSPSPGKGELSYKRVTKTLVHEEAADIYLIACTHAVVKDGKRQILGGDYIGVTWNHPFYTKRFGWLKAAGLGSGMEVELANGNYASSTTCVPIYQTNVPDVGWAPFDDSDDNSRQWRSGDIVEFEPHGFRVRSAPSTPGLPEDFPKIVRTVHSLELEDNAIYCVGRLGILVKNPPRPLR